MQNQHCLLKQFLNNSVENIFQQLNINIKNGNTEVETNHNKNNSSFKNDEIDTKNTPNGLVYKNANNETRS